MIYPQTQIGGEMDRTNGGATTSGRNDSFPTEDEWIVAQILLDLMPMMSLTHSLADSNWKRKRRRSCFDQILPLPSVQSSQNPIKAAEKDGGEIRTTTSPDSPFLLAQSDESDEKSKHSSKTTSAKRSKKNHLDMIQQLTQQKVFLQGEIDNVKKYCTKLMAYNAELKTIKQKISVGTNVEIALTHGQPFTVDPTAQEIQYPITAHLNNGLGPIGFDLNETLDSVVDERQPFDVNRVIADERARSAEARKTRRRMMKMKKSIKRRGLRMS